MPKHSDASSPTSPMQGRRRPDATELHQLANGEYARDARGDWICTTPNGLGGALRKHEVVEHEDGTVTVSPSILVTRGGTKQEFHGWLQRGVWTW